VFYTQHECVRFQNPSKYLKQLQSTQNVMATVQIFSKHFVEFSSIEYLLGIKLQIVRHCCLLATSWYLSLHWSQKLHFPISLLKPAKGAGKYKLQASTQAFLSLTTSFIKNMAVSWVVAPCSLVEVYQRFRGPCCLHHQGDEWHSSSCSPPWEPQILQTL
jgi:hypothetical protein